MGNEFIIHKVNGKKMNTKKISDYWDSLEDGTYKVVITRNDKRSLNQNSWLHAVLPEILKGLRDVGYNDVRTEEDAKDFIKSLFFKKSVSNGTDTVEVIEGTSKQSKINFTEKAEDIIIWAQTYLGIDIAPPAKQFNAFS